MGGMGGMLRQVKMLVEQVEERVAGLESWKTLMRPFLC